MKYDEEKLVPWGLQITLAGLKDFETTYAFFTTASIAVELKTAPIQSVITSIGDSVLRALFSLGK